MEAKDKVNVLSPFLALANDILVLQSWARHLAGAIRNPWLLCSGLGRNPDRSFCAFLSLGPSILRYRMVEREEVVFDAKKIGQIALARSLGINEDRKMTIRGADNIGFQCWVAWVLILFFAVAAGCSRGTNEETQKLLAAKAMKGDIAGMEQALGKGADLNQEWMFNSPLSWAIDSGQLTAVKFLVLRGANINAHFGLPKRTALQQAAEGGNVDIVVYLVEAGADVNARNKFGRTALHHARRGLGKDPRKTEEVVRYLVSKGAVE